MLEDKKFELKDEDLDNISGGAFVYKDTTGDGIKDTCEVEGIGTFHCNGLSKDNITRLFLANQTMPLAELVELAIAKGYIW